jgi:hypothetical protein
MNKIKWPPFPFIVEHTNETGVFHFLVRDYNGIWEDKTDVEGYIRINCVKTTNEQVVPSFYVTVVTPIALTKMLVTGSVRIIHPTSAEFTELVIGANL